MKKSFIIFLLLLTTILTAKNLEYYEEHPAEYEDIKKMVFENARDKSFQPTVKQTKKMFKVTLRKSMGHMSIIHMAKEYINKYGMKNDPDDFVNNFHSELQHIYMTKLTYFGIENKDAVFRTKVAKIVFLVLILFTNIMVIRSKVKKKREKS